MADSPQRRLAQALVAVRKGLGFPSAYAACHAQKHLSYDQYTKRERGYTTISVMDVVNLAHDWGKSPAELFCLLSEEMDGSTFEPLAVKCGLTSSEAKKRFKAKQIETGLSFDQLFLLITKDQIQL